MKKKAGIYGVILGLLVVISIPMANGQGKKDETTVAESTISGNVISDNTISENTISENTISENSVSGNVGFSGQQNLVDIEEEEYEYEDFAFADVDDYVNVRNQPSIEGEIVGKIYDGAVAEILATAGENEDWYQIVSGNVEGYIKAEFFLRGKEAASVMDKYVTRYAQVKADQLNIRKEASIESDRIGYVVQGERLKVLEDGEEWVQIQYTDSVKAYVAAEYVMVREEFVYAKTLEEEAQEIAARRELEQRQAQQMVIPEETIQIQLPATTYTSNEELRTQIVNYALQFVGNRYISGGRSLAGGTDCSGFTCYIYADFGYSISRIPQGQFTGAGRSIGLEEIQPGDIVCYSSDGGRSCTHVAMYIGNGQIVHSANSRKGVIISGINFEPIMGFRNVID